MNGPQIQMPGAQAPLVTMLKRAGDLLALLTTEWSAFFNTVGRMMWASTRSGPSADRPTAAVSPRWVGMMYFDTDIGRPIYLKSVNPDKWVNSDGAPV